MKENGTEHCLLICNCFSSIFYQVVYGGGSMNSLGKNLKKIRKTKKMTQEELAGQLCMEF